MEKMDYLIKNAYIVTMDEDKRVLKNGYITVKNGKIMEVSAQSLPKDMSAKHTIDAMGKVVFPGFVDTHMHMFQTLFKGLGRDKRLFDWLDSSVRPGLHRLDPNICYTAALAGCIESIHSGTTTVLDYMYAHAIPDTDDGVLKAMEDIGIRGILGRAKIKSECYPAEFHVTHHETEQFFFDEVRRLHKLYDSNDRIDIAMAPGIIFEVSEDAFVEMRKIANETGMRITMHLLETKDDDAFCLKENGMRCTPYLDKLGFLGPDFLAVHCVVANDEDLGYFKKHDVKISHNPLSNMILGSGVAPVVKMREMGLTVSLACDGAASNDTQDMLEVIKMTSLLQKVSQTDPAVMPAAEVLEMATMGGAKAVGKEDSIGSIEIGKQADLFLYDPIQYRSVPVYDPISSLVYCSGSNNVDTVMINGKLVMEKGVITTVDEEKVLWETQNYAKMLARDLNLGNEQWGRRVEPWW